MKKLIYLDHAATTNVDAEVLEKMLPYFSEHYGNSGSLHTLGRNAAKAVDAARDDIAEVLNCKRTEVYFTSGGTESDNWAIRGVAYAYKNKGNHIITSKIEHHAVLNTCKKLESEGFEVTYLNVDKYGVVDLKQLEESIRPETTLITIMAANNEVGTIQPYGKIGEICKSRGVLFHTDAVQAIGTTDIDVKRDNIDLLSISGHKFYGPKGVGVLYVRNGIRLDRFMSGGGQERNRRAGTTNVPLIIGMAAALKKAIANREENNKYLSELRDYLIASIEREIPDVYLNGHRTERLANNVSFCFEFIEGEAILLHLDMAGICVSSGSACTSGSLEPSHVLAAMGIDIAVMQSATRFSLGKQNTKEDIDYVVDNLKRIIANLRALSPLFKQEKGDIKYV